MCEKWRVTKTVPADKMARSPYFARLHAIRETQADTCMEKDENKPGMSKATQKATTH